MNLTLKQGDVRLDDIVRIQMPDGGSVQGAVVETASDGGVVCVEIDGLPFSAGLPFVELIRRPSLDLLVADIQASSPGIDSAVAHRVAEGLAERGWTQS